ARVVFSVRRRGLRDVPRVRLDRDRRLGHGRPERAPLGGLRPGGGVRIRVRLGPRADRDAAPRLPGPARPLARRPALPQAVLMKVPLSWLREYVDVDVPVDELAARLSTSTCEVERISRRGVPDTDGNLGLFR